MKRRWETLTEDRKTALFCGVAIVLGLLAWITTPRTRTPGVFMDRGELFFPQFTDPNAAASLEVIEFDEQSAAVRPFKVLNRAGHWTIPSQYNYPADAKDHLAQTAATVIALRKDDFVSDNTSDHERCGVLDPLDATLPQLKGRGTRVTIRSENDQLLADVIIGRPAEGREDVRYVRLPGQKRVYLSRVGDLKISTNFADWIERDLLQTARQDIDDVGIRNYSLDESTGRLHMREAFAVHRKGEDQWSVAGMAPDEEINTVPLNLLISNLVGLKIVGVLPKPPGISAMLSQSGAGGKVSQTDVADLSRKGFFVTPDGQLFANEGEVIIHTTGGIFYTLRFGEVAPGSSQPAAPVPNTAPTTTAARVEPGENRYLFIMVGFDPASARASARSTSDNEKAATLLRARFAPWYYIISADSFSKIRVQRKDLVRKTVRPRQKP